jgi:uncharacterized protein (DUF697 family)/GTP-binding protein EngB required for normal cell division
MTNDPTERRDAVVPAIDDRPFIDATAEASSRYGRFNLAVIGNTGVGKSSLVNAVFGRDLAAVGHGLPVSRGIRYYHDTSLGIWDFEGFEIGTDSTPAEALRGHLASIRQRPAVEQIAVVWYCVLANSSRLTPADIAIIRELDAAGIPVMVVLTKVAWTKNPVTGKRRAPEDVERFRDWLQNPVDAAGTPITVPVRGVVLTSAHATNGKGAGHGLGDLLAQTLALSPDDAKDAFRIAQRLNLPWKKEMARPVIAAATTAAATAAAVPLPVADAATLAPIQLAMMGRIAAIYDLELKSMLTASGIAQLSAQLAGQALARSFVKLIPGAGSVINASVAASLTGAMGEAWRRLCEKVHTGDIELSQVSDVWKASGLDLPMILRNLVEQRVSRRK